MAEEPRTNKSLSRLAWYRILLRFAITRGLWPSDAIRLFYHTGLKPSLAFRGLTTFHPQDILAFSARGRKGARLRIHCRDNGSDVGTFEEFFSTRYTIIPPELPPFEPAVIYDIGANIGIASLYYACRFPRARLFGFEPVPDNFQTCQLNYRNLLNSQAFLWAVGAKTGTSIFNFDEGDLRGGSLPWISEGPKTKNKQIQVEVYSVADLVLKKALPPPDFLKIDVEGAEIQVLEGLGTAALSIKRIMIETHSERLMAGCMKWALENGFIIRHVHEAAPGFAAIWCDRLAVTVP